MGDRFYKSVITGALLLTAAFLSIAVFVFRHYQRYSATYNKYIWRIKTRFSKSWQYLCASAGIRTSPILILGGMAYLLFIRHEISADAVNYLFGSGILITVLWFSFDHYINRQGMNIAFKLHDHIETQDRNTASEIVEGLNRVKYLDPFIPGEPKDLTRMRAMINEIAKNALIPSVYCDHHCREIASYDDPMHYIRTKRDLIVDAFNLEYHEDYLQLVLNRLPSTISFEESVESYVSDLFVEVIGPALIRCCETKIYYYDLVLRDWTMSRLIRGKAKLSKAKNEQYINNVRELCNYSTIISSAIKSRERS